MEAGTFEESFFAIPGAGETNKLLNAARKTLDTARMLRRIERLGERKLSVAERAIAALQASAVRVFEELLALARLNKGKVFPTYEYLAERTNYGRATVIQQAVATGSARKKDLSILGGGILTNAGVGALGANYTSTDMGKITTLAMLDALRKLMTQDRNP